MKQSLKKTRRMVVVTCLYAFALALMMGIAPPAHATSLLPPGIPPVNYSFSAGVQTGTIRYISQNDGRTNNAPRSGYFDDRYWGGYWLQPHYELACSGPGYECATASISMALSYIGINKTPQDILDAHNGETCFDGWGAAELQYPTLSDAVDRLQNGGAKYSPAIIHFSAGAPGYPNGHYVIVIGKSGGNAYTILDCNRDAIWTLSSDDPLYSYIDCIMQYYNSEAVIQPKVIVPSDVTPSKLQLEVTSRGGAVIRTGSARTYSVVRHADKGEYLYAIGYTWNNKNNLWYFLEDGTYIYSGNVRVSQCISSASIGNVSAPSGTLYARNVFVLRGELSGNNIIKVTVTVKNRDGETVLTSSDSVSETYSLQNSPIDRAITFNTLQPGSYTYEILVSETADTGSRCITFNTVIWSSTFSIV